MPYGLHLDFSKIIIPHEKRMSKKKDQRDDFVIVNIYGNQKNTLTIVSFGLPDAITVGIRHLFHVIGTRCIDFCYNTCLVCSQLLHMYVRDHTAHVDIISERR